MFTNKKKKLPKRPRRPIPPFPKLDLQPIPVFGIGDHCFPRQICSKRSRTKEYPEGSYGQGNCDYNSYFYLGERFSNFKFRKSFISGNVISVPIEKYTYNDSSYKRLKLDLDMKKIM